MPSAFAPQTAHLKKKNIHKNIKLGFLKNRVLTNKKERKSMSFYTKLKQILVWNP